MASDSERRQALSKAAERLLGKPIITDEKIAQFEGEVKGFPTAESAGRRLGNITEGMGIVAKRVIEGSDDPYAALKKRAAKSWDQQEEFVQRRIKSAKENEWGQVVGQAGNLAQGLFDLVTFAPQLAMAIDAAVDKSPEAVADFTTDVVAGIPVGMMHTLANPESFRADPIGYVATLTGVVGALKQGARAGTSKTLSTAKKFIPKEKHKRFDDFVAQAPAAWESIKNKPIPKTEAFKRFIDEDVKHPGLTKGQVPITVGDVSKMVGGGAAAGYFLTGDVASATTAILGGAVPAIRTLVGVARAGNTPDSITKALTSIDGSFQRMFKTVSGSSQMSNEAIKAAILSEAAIKGSVLESYIRRAEDLIQAGKLDEMNTVLSEMATSPDVRDSIINSEVTRIKIDADGIGRILGGKEDVVDRVRQEIDSGRLHDNLAPEVKEQVDAALDILRKSLGEDKLPAQTEARVRAIGSLDSLIFGNDIAMRKRAIERIESDLGRKLSSKERDNFHRRGSQLAALTVEAGTPVGAVFSYKASNGQRKRYNLRELYNTDLRGMSTKDRGNVLAARIGETLRENKGRVLARERAKAIERDATGWLNKKDSEGNRYEDYEKLDAFLNMTAKERADRAISHDVVEEAYIQALIKRVVDEGNPVPMTAPPGINMKSVASRIRGREGYKKSPALQSLARQLDDSTVMTGANLLHNELRKDIDRTALKEGFLEDLRQAKGDKAVTKEIGDQYKSWADAIGADLHGGQVSVRNDFAKTLGWVDNWTQDANRFAQMNNTITGTIKGGLTKLTTGVHAANFLANELFSSVDRGISPFAVIKDTVETTRKATAYLHGDRSKLTKADNDIMKMIDEMGFKFGDATNVEMRNFLKDFDPNLPATQALEKVLDLPVVRQVKRAAQKATGKAGEKYSWGDTAPKINEAYYSIKKLGDGKTPGLLKDLADGQSIQIMTHRGVFRTFHKKNGELYYKGKKASNKDIRDTVMAFARRRANERFKDFNARPGFLRVLDRVGLGGFFNPFLTWSAKAMGIGDPGMATILFGPKLEVLSSDPAIMGRLAKESIQRDLRRALAMQTARHWVNDDKDAVVKASQFGEEDIRTSTLVAREAQGLVDVNNLSVVASIIPQAKLMVNAAKIWTNLFDDNERNKIRRAAKGYGSPHIENMQLAMEALGLTGGMFENFYNGFVKKPANKKDRLAIKRAREFFKRGIVGGTPYDVYVGMKDAAKEMGIIDADASDESYYDYLKTKVPKSQLPSRMNILLEKLAGPLPVKALTLGAIEGGQPKILAKPNIEKYKNTFKSTVISRYLRSTRDNLFDQWYRPVQRRYGKDSDEAVEAYVMARDFFNNRRAKVFDGYEEVFEERPPESFMESNRFPTRESWSGRVPKEMTDD